MRHFLIVGLIAGLITAAPLAGAQEASPEQMEAASAVAKCLIAGLPADWYEAQVIVTLDAPGALSGEGRYVFSRQLARNNMEPFKPCDSRNPARALVEMRRLQPVERRGWKSARFVLHRDGKFDLTYDYPKE
jgi:hypothetical protein